MPKIHDEAIIRILNKDSIHIIDVSFVSSSVWHWVSLCEGCGVEGMPVEASWVNWDTVGPGARLAGSPFLRSQLHMKGKRVKDWLSLGDLRLKGFFVFFIF